MRWDWVVVLRGGEVLYRDGGFCGDVDGEEAG
jgi:hypothetical protein